MPLKLSLRRLCSVALQCVVDRAGPRIAPTQQSVWQETGTAA
eukprot:CAMPEP_0172753006 /NCGR_PEP_ID=MMETSP1074-20121228/155021_1 /TAXON_ID=2916 /ORGANISM="Ceratium fusus, Strain PA161109" /LENGTH=41 /DNA_ID= /DNA_START= /DNA_END= /DNA_ORIENTATION=